MSQNTKSGLVINPDTFPLFDQKKYTVLAGRITGNEIRDLAVMEQENNEVTTLWNTTEKNLEIAKNLGKDACYIMYKADVSSNESSLQEVSLAERVYPVRVFLIDRENISSPMEVTIID